MVSSHDLEGLERICDWVVMLKGGRLLREGTLADVTGRTFFVRWELGPGAIPLDALAARLPGHTFTTEPLALVHRAPEDGDLDAASLVVMEELARAGVALRGARRGVGLERRFIEDVTG